MTNLQISYTWRLVLGPVPVTCCPSWDELGCLAQSMVASASPSERLGQGCFLEWAVVRAGSGVDRSNTVAYSGEGELRIKEPNIFNFLYAKVV